MKQSASRRNVSETTAMIETSAQRLESIRSSSQQPRPRLGCPVVETELLKLFYPFITKPYHYEWWNVCKCKRSFSLNVSHLLRTFSTSEDTLCNWVLWNKMINKAKLKIEILSHLIQRWVCVNFLQVYNWKVTYVFQRMNISQVQIHKSNRLPYRECVTRDNCVINNIIIIPKEARTRSFERVKWRKTQGTVSIVPGGWFGPQLCFLTALWIQAGWGKGHDAC